LYIEDYEGQDDADKIQLTNKRCQNVGQVKEEPGKSELHNWDSIGIRKEHDDET